MTDYLLVFSIIANCHGGCCTNYTEKDRSFYVQESNKLEKEGQEITALSSSWWYLLLLLLQSGVSVLSCTFGLGLYE